MNEENNQSFEKSSEDENPVIHAWMKEELDRREDNARLHPEANLSWEEVKARVRAKHGR